MKLTDFKTGKSFSVRLITPTSMTSRYRRYLEVENPRDARKVNKINKFDNGNVWLIKYDNNDSEMLDGLITIENCCWDKTLYRGTFISNLKAIQLMK